jgi:hypothetical protein
VEEACSPEAFTVSESAGHGLRFPYACGERFSDGAGRGGDDHLEDALEKGFDGASDLLDPRRCCF